MKRTLFGIIVLTQLVIIMALFIKIQKGSALGAHISPSKVAVFKPENSKYKYFYELAPNTHDTVKQLMVDFDKNITNQINNDSLSERYDYPLKKDPSTLRIITLGDSFTYGYNVNTSDAWSEVLEKFLLNYEGCRPFNKFEVINLGVYGYNIKYEVERYRLRGQKYDPDLVVWLVEDDDFIENEEQIKEILADEGKSTVEVDNQSYFEAWKKSVDTTGFDNVVADQVKALKSIRQFYKKNILLLHIGKDDQIIKGLNTFDKDDPQTYFMPLTLNRKLIFTDAHPNEKGHIYIADKVYNYITKNKILPCSK